MLSAFDIPWADTGLSDGKGIQFRILMGSNDVFGPQTPALLWEVNSFQVDGVKLCAVPEPASLALALVGGLRYLLAFRHRSPRRPTAGGRGDQRPAPVVA